MLLGHKGKKKITAPVKHDPGKGYDTEHLAYLSPTEMEILRYMTDGTVSRGPRGIPSFVAPPSTAQKAANAAAMAAATQRVGPATIGGTPNTPGALGGNQGSQRAGGSNAGSQKPGGTNNGAMGGTGLRGPTGPQGQAKSQAQMQGVNQTAAAMASAAAKGQLGQPQGAFQGGGQGAFGKIAGGLRGATGPMGEPRTQPANYGTNYQTAQMMRSAYPGVAARTSQTQLANALNTFSRAMPGEAGINMFGTGAMNNIGRVGLNQIVGGFSPEKMLRGMDTTGMRPATRGFDKPGPNSMGMVPVGSPQQTLASVALRESLTGAGVSPTAMNASNFVSAGTPMVRGVNPVGQPIAGTQFGHDPTWGNRIQMANLAAADKFNLGSQLPTSMMASLGPVSPAAPSRQTLSQISRASVTPTSLATKSQGVNPPVDDPGYIGMMPTPRGMPIALPGAGAVPGPISRPGSGFPTQLATRSQGVSPPLDDPGFNTMMGAPRGMPTALPGAGAVPGMIQRQTAPQWNDTGRVNFNDMLSDKVTAVEPARQPPSTFAGPGSPTYASPVPSRSPLDMAPTPQPGINPANLVEGGVPTPLQSVTTMGIDDKASYWGVNLESKIAGAFLNPDQYPEVKAQIEKAKAAGVTVNPVTGQVTAPKSAMAELGKLWDAMARSKYAGLPALENMTQVASTGMVPTPRQKPQTLGQIASQSKPGAPPRTFAGAGSPSYASPVPNQVQLAGVWQDNPMPAGMPANIGKWLEQGKPTPPAKPHLGTPTSQTAQNAPQGGAFQNVSYTPSKPKSPPQATPAVVRGLLGGNMQTDPGDRGSKRKKRRRRGAFQQVTA